MCGVFNALRTEQITHSERVAIGEAIEQELEGRVGRPAAETKENFPELPQGQTRDLAAKAAGFGNGKTYATSVQHLFNGRWYPDLVSKPVSMKTRLLRSAPRQIRAVR